MNQMEIISESQEKKKKESCEMKSGLRMRNHWEQNQMNHMKIHESGGGKRANYKVTNLLEH